MNKNLKIENDKEYPLMRLVNEGVFPNMTHYTTVLHNLIDTDIIKHRVIKRFDKDGNEKVFARRYFVKGWSLNEYLKSLNKKESEVVKIQEGGVKDE